MQIALAAAGVGLFVWMVYSSVVFFTYRSTLSATNSALKQAKASYQHLLTATANQRREHRIFTHRLKQSKQAWLQALAEKSALRSKLLATEKMLGHSRDLYEQMLKMRDAVTDELEQLQAELVNLKRLNKVLLASKLQLQEKLDASLARKEAIQKERDHLQGKLAWAHEQNCQLNSAREELFHQLVSVQDSLARVKTEREGLVAHRTFLEGRVENLERRLDTFKQVQESLVTKLTERSEKMEEILSQTGLDIDSLMEEIRNVSEQDSLISGKGGPFVAYAPEMEERDFIGSREDIVAVLTDLDSEVQHLTHLHELLRRLPLIPPVDRYEVTSDFGKRRDPVNGRYAMHDGLDMRGKWKALILAPAEGRVVFTGWRSTYGRVIEIDHGMGIRTRYAHLRKILVKKGQIVKFRDKIGVMGSSGRSTGRHVHYEVLVDGKPYDPKKFIEAGKHVFKG